MGDTTTQEPSRNVVHQRTYAMVLLGLTGLMNYMDRFLLSALIEPIKQDLGISDTSLGLLTGFALVLFFASVSLPLGRLADRSMPPQGIEAILLFIMIFKRRLSLRKHAFPITAAHERQVA